MVDNVNSFVSINTFISSLEGNAIVRLFSGYFQTPFRKAIYFPIMQCRLLDRC